MQYYQYPSKVTENTEGVFIISFRDIPEAFTQTRDKNKIYAEALYCLIDALSIYLDTGEKIPEASAPRKGEILISLPPSVIAKIMLLNTMAETKVRPVDLAKKMNVRPQEVTRIMNVKQSTKIDTISEALKVLGKKLTLYLA